MLAYALFNHRGVIGGKRAINCVVAECGRVGRNRLSAIRTHCIWADVKQFGADDVSERDGPQYKECEAF